MDDLFDYARRSTPAPKPIDDEMWSIKIVRNKTGLSRASVYKYMVLGLFPRQRHLGPGRVAWRASEVRSWIETRPE
ncbi:MAG: AlpA family phage regulatory protein [Hyphomicrobiaceae bacterium]